ncbi:MAG: hypothetical protein GY722_06055 [bacterium]|nr:hypothetical protein [bacterium]
MCTRTHTTTAEIRGQASGCDILALEVVLGLETVQMRNNPSSDWARSLVAALGSFDLQRVEAVTSCLVRSVMRDELLVELILLYEGREVVLMFEDVQRARLPEATRVGLQLGDPLVERVDGDGLERIRYRLTDEIEDWLIESGDLQVRVR